MKTSFLTSMSLPVVALLVFNASPSQAQDDSTNLVVNGGFEEWVPATSDQINNRKGQDFQCAELADGMTVTNFDLICEKPGEPPQVSVVRDEQEKHSGTCSIKMTSGNTEQIGSIYSKRFPVEPSKKYKLTLWYKMDSVSGNGVTIWVAQGPAQTFNEAAKSTLFRPDNKTGFSEWIPYETIFETSDIAQEANVCLQLQSSSGTVWFDDLSITPAPDDAVVPAPAAN